MCCSNHSADTCDRPAKWWPRTTHGRLFRLVSIRSTEPCLCPCGHSVPALIFCSLILRFCLSVCMQNREGSSLKYISTFFFDASGKCLVATHGSFYPMRDYCTFRGGSHIFGVSKHCQAPVVRKMSESGEVVQNSQPIPTKFPIMDCHGAAQQRVQTA